MMVPNVIQLFVLPPTHAMCLFTPFKCYSVILLHQLYKVHFRFDYQNQMYSPGIIMFLTLWLGLLSKTLSYYQRKLFCILYAMHTRDVTLPMSLKQWAKEIKKLSNPQLPTSHWWESERFISWKKA